MKKRKSTFANFLLNSFRKNFKALCSSVFHFTRLVVVIASS